MPSLRSLLLLQALLLVALGGVLGWGAIGWVAAIGATVLLDAAVARLRHSCPDTPLGPADVVTLVRATLVCGVLGFVAQGLLGGAARPLTLAALAGVALVGDLVDGWVARRTGTESDLGARLDGEVDAFLMLVLSVWIAPDQGWWVLAIGLARYAFGLAGMVLPWLAARLPARYWRKVVTAVSSIALVLAAARVLPSPAVDLVLLVALLLLLESFGRDVWWLWRRRPASRSG